MPYHSKPNGVNPTPISGRYLAYNHAGPIKRAFIAADLHLGASFLTAPTQTQAAALARVNASYVCWAVRRQAERADIERGHTPLIPSHGEVVVPNMNGTAPAAAPASGIDDAGLVQFVRSVGIDRVIHAAIAVERAQH
jgi:hypothetical protein